MSEIFPVHQLFEPEPILPQWDVGKPLLSRTKQSWQFYTSPPEASGSQVVVMINLCGEA